MFNNVTLNVGIVVILSFIFTFLVFLMQYWLCYAKKGKDDNHDKNDHNKQKKGPAAGQPANYA